jgi:hypothetical protein
MRSSLFWDVTQRRLVVTDVSGQSVGAVASLDCLTLDDGTDRLSRNVGN